MNVRVGERVKGSNGLLLPHSWVAKTAIQISYE